MFTDESDNYLFVDVTHFGNTGKESMQLLD